MKGLRCPHCKEIVHFGKQMTEWDNEFGDSISSDPEESWAWIAVWCSNCDQYAYNVDLSGAFTEEVPAPEQMKKDIPGSKILALPKMKKPKN